MVRSHIVYISRLGAGDLCLRTVSPLGAWPYLSAALNRSPLGGARRTGRTCRSRRVACSIESLATCGHGCARGTGRCRCCAGARRARERACSRAPDRPNEWTTRQMIDSSRKRSGREPEVASGEFVRSEQRSQQMDTRDTNGPARPCPALSFVVALNLTKPD